MSPKSKMVKMSALSSALMLTMGASGMATAAPKGQLEEVIVTAQKRSQQLQDVPIAITAFTANQLTRQGITNVEDVARAVPSITVAPFPSSSTTLILYMRGQGLDDPGQITRDGAVALYEDGFFISRPQSSTFDLADVERVEVLRGPQGTLYGRNTTGGAVNLISKKPTGEFGFKQTLEFGNRNKFRSLTTVNLPQWHNLSAKATLLSSSIDGYVRNIGASHDYGEESQRAARIDLRWQASTALTVDYFFEHGQIDSTPYYYQAPYLNGAILYDSLPYYAAPNRMPHTYRSIDLKEGHSEFDGHGLTLTWDVGESLTIKSLTGYRTLDYKSYQDYADSFASTYASYDKYNDRQFSEEFQFLGNLFDHQLTYVVGLYYFNEQGSHYAEANVYSIPYITYRRVPAKSTSKAIYAQVTWTPPILDNKMELTFGTRYTDDEKTARRYFANNFFGLIDNGAATGANNKQRTTRSTPSFTLNYHWTDQISTYAKVSTGYKAGGSIETAPVGGFNVTFGPEKLINYEVGLKSEWLDRRLRANLALYDSDYQDIQVQVQADPNDPSAYFAYNAGKATIRGAEVELQIVPIDDLSLNVSYAYTDTKVDEIKVAADTILDPAVNSASPYQVGQDVSDLFNLPYVSKHSVSVDANYTFFHFGNGDLSASLNYRWRSSYFMDPYSGKGVPNRQYDKTPSYGVVNGRVTLAVDLAKGSKLTVALWGKNLTDKQYYQHMIVAGGFMPINAGGVTTPAGFVGRDIAWSEPRTYGISLTYDY